MNYKVKKRPCFLVMLAFYGATWVHAQDTLRLTLPDVEKLFLQKNLSLLAEGYNINMAQAQLIQARLYNNPNVQFTGAIYNPQQRKVLDLSNQTGEYIVAIQQIILLAGKRNKQIKLAETNALLAENRFYDLLRTLRFLVRSSFFQTFFLQNSINAYGVQIASLENLSATYQRLLEKGMVTLKDAVRIRSLLYSLKAEHASLQNQFNDVETQIQLLLQNNRTVFLPVADVNVATLTDIRRLSLLSLIDTAYNNRNDLKLVQNNVLYNQQNYSVQKSLATPNLLAGASFDKRGTFVPNASLFTLAMDLPFFNRNQGNIKAAQIGINQSKLLVTRQVSIVENEVQHAYVNAMNTDKMLQSIDPNFRGQFEQLLKAITQNFEKRNLSLLEFTDFYDSYKQNILQLNQLQNAKMQAIENLNFAVGKTVINY